MRAAVLFRGHHYSKIGERRGTGTDWRKCVESHRKNLIGPLRKMTDYRVDLVLSTYASQYEDELLADYNPFAAIFVTSSTQRATVLRGLRGLDLMDKYHLVVICRFDIEVKGNPFTHPGLKLDKVNFLWREWNESSWNDHRRVPDALHFLPGKYLDGFRRGIEKTPSDSCLHLVYHPVAREIGEENINIIDPNGFVDSNTDVMPNIFYHIVRTRE